MVGPTWMSLIWAMVKPCSAAGRLAMGTSTRLTRAVRRVLSRPSSVSSRASTGTTWALAVRSDGPPLSSSQAASSTTSRARVSTNSDENRPSANRPAVARRSDAGGRAQRRAVRPIGTSTVETTSHSTRVAAATGGSAATRRMPMSRWNRPERRNNAMEVKGR
jgi:hypothetical protein